MIQIQARCGFRHVAHWSSGCVLALTCCLSGIGCAKQFSGWVPVVGTLSLSDGGKLPAGVTFVRFFPNHDKGNAFGDEPIGFLGEDGKYTLKCKGESRVPTGWYRVSASSGPQVPGGPTRPKPGTRASFEGSLILPRYALPETSGLEIEVTSSPASGAYDLRLEPYKGR